jgi:acetyl esterase/lipase
MRSQLRPLSHLTVLATVGIALLATPRFILGQEATFAQKTFTYKVVSDTEIQADVYRADDDLARPVLVWIHGGALMFGTRRTPPLRLLDLCRIAGFVLVSIDYRLAPTVTLPAIIEDLEDAFAWIRHEGPRLYGADPDKLAVAGASAGGYLTMASGIRVKPRPTALVAYYGYGSLDSPWYTEPSEYYRTSVPIVTEEEAYRPGGPLYLYFRQNGLWTQVVTGFDPVTQRQELDPYTPVRNITPEYPPIMMLHGTLDNDVPYEESVAMAERLARHSVQHELILLPGGGHGLGGADPKLVTDAQNRALAFIHRHLTGEARATEIVPLLDALALLDAGVNLALQGNLSEAIDAYAEAQRLESRVTVSAQVRNTLCWYGALWGFAEEVMEACEEAVALAPDLMRTRLSRGLARALTGDAEGAILDLEAWVAWTQTESARSETQDWIDALHAGRNPFTPEVLEELRNR